MNNRPHDPASRRRALPTLVLAALAATLVLSSTAVADPIVIVPPTDVAGTEVSGSVANDPEADACIGNEHSGADPADPSVVQLNDASCQAGSGTGTPSANGSPSANGTSGAAGAQGSRTQTTSATGSGARSGSAGASGTAGGRGSAATTVVAAADAVGLRISAVRRLTKNVRLTRNLRVFVTVRDTRGFRVRGAFVSLTRVPGRQNTVSDMHADFSNRRGVAKILVPVTKRMFGKPLFLKVAARTPKARAVVLRSVSLPHLR